MAEASAHSDRMSALDDIRAYDPLHVEESAIAFNPALHPRDRRGEFADVLGKLHREIHVPGTQMKITVTDRPHLGQRQQGGYGLEKGGFQSGDRVVLPDGRTGTVTTASHARDGEQHYLVSTERGKAGSRAWKDEQIHHEGKYVSRQTAIENVRKAAKERFSGTAHEAEQVQKAVDEFLTGWQHREGGIEQKTVPHSKLKFTPEAMAERQQRGEDLAAKAAKGGASRMPFSPVQYPVTLNTGVVPGEWQVEHGYGEWQNPAHRNPSEGDRVRVMPTHPEHAGKVGVVAQSGSPMTARGDRLASYDGPGSQVNPLVLLDGGKEPIAIRSNYLMGEEQKPWVRQKPGTNVEKMIFHYLAGKPPPANPAPGTQAWEQWTYGMKGMKGATKAPGKKADREALIRKITQALDARAANDPAGYVLALTEACELRATCGPVIGETADEIRGSFDPLFVEETTLSAIHFDPTLHPRNRKGEFADVLSRLGRGVEVQLPHGITVAKGRLGGYKIEHPGGASHTMDMGSAVHQALSVHDSRESPRRPEARMTPAQADALGLWKPGGRHGMSFGPVRSEDQTDFGANAQRILDRRARARAEVTGTPSARSRANSKAQALVDAGLADNLADARAQLADMGDGGLLSPGGERSKDMPSFLMGLGPGKHEITANGVPFTLYYDERGATGDSGGRVAGDKTGDWEVFRGHGDTLGAAIARVHVSPHGTSGYGNAAAPRYAAEQVAQAITAETRKSQGGRPSPGGERVMGSDAAVAVGRFKEGGPDGYKAAGWPDAKLRKKRETAVEDQRKWLELRHRDFSSGDLPDVKDFKYLSDDQVKQLAERVIPQARGAVHDQSVPGEYRRDLAGEANRRAARRFNAPSGKASPGGERGSSGAEVWSGPRIDGLRDIVARHQAREIDGMLVDVQTANLLAKVYDALSPANKERFGTASMSRIASLAWSLAR